MFLFFSKGFYVFQNFGDCVKVLMVWSTPLVLVYLLCRRFSKTYTFSRSYFFPVFKPFFDKVMLCRKKFMYVVDGLCNQRKQVTSCILSSGRRDQCSLSCIWVKRAIVATMLFVPCEFKIAIVICETENIFSIGDAENFKCPALQLCNLWNK